MKKWKHVLAYVMSLVMVLSCVTGITFTAEASTNKNNPTEIAAGDTKDIVISNPGEAYWVKFTPEEDGTYVFYSQGEADSKAYLYDSLANEEAYINQDDDGLGQGNNFRLSYSMEKDKTYYLKACLWNNEAGSYTLYLKKAVPATAISFEEDTYTTYVGNNINFGLTFEPAYAQQTYTYAVNTPNIISTSDNQNWAEALSAGTVTLTVTTTSGKTDTCTIIVKNPKNIAVGGSSIVEGTDNGNEVSEKYQITVPKDGMYALYSEDCQSGYFHFYGEQTVTSHSYNEVCVAVAELKTGETYSATVYNQSNTSYTLHLSEAVKATGIVIAEEAIEGYPGDYFYLNVSWEPIIGIPEACTWSSDNEEVVTVNEYGEVTLKKVGTATITVRTTSGLTDTCSVTVLEAEKLHVGDTKTIDVKSGNYKRFEFTPEKSGKYTLYSEDCRAGELFLYDSNWNQLAQNYWEDDTIIVAAELEAGKTYYFECANYMTSPYAVKLAEMKQATEMAFEYSTYTGYVGEAKNLYVTFGPGLVSHENWTLTSQNPEIVAIVGQNEIELLKVGTTKITATSDNSLTCECTVTVKAPEILKLDEEKTVSVTRDQEVVCFTFTPTESGSYAFYSTDGNDSYGALFEADNMDTELTGNSGSGVGDNFKVVASLDAGKTYAYIYEIYYNESDSVSVKLQKVTNITGIQLSPDHIDGYVEDFAYLELDLLPVNSAESTGAVTWTSSNPEIAQITGGDNTWCELYLKKEGTVTIKAEMGNYTDTCTITVGKVPAIQINDTKPINIQYKQAYGMYKFTPEKNGTYIFSTKSAFPVWAEVYDSEDNSIAFDDGTGKNPNVALEVELKAGETYTFMSGYIVMSKTGSYTVTLIDKDNPPVITPDDNQNTDSGKQESTSPGTGDYAATWLWTAFMLTAALVCCGIVIDRKRK